MKKIDVTENVMKQVERFEKSRSSMWLRGFYTGVVVMVILVGIFFWSSIQTISDLQGWDLLSVFTQDREIIRDYWQDTVLTFITELPLETLAVAFAIFVFLVIIVFITRKRRMIYEFRMRELAKRSNIRKNSK